MALDRLGRRGKPLGSRQTGRLQGPRHDHRRAPGEQVRPGHRARGCPAGQRLPDQDRVDRPRGIGREGGRRHRRAGPAAGGDEDVGRHAQPSRRRRRTSPRPSSTRPSISPSPARTFGPPSTPSRRRRSPRSRRSSRRRASSARRRSTTRRRSARSSSRSATSTPRPSRRSPRCRRSAPTSASSRTTSRTSRTSWASFTDQGAIGRHGDLRSRVERQEEGRRLAVERVGSDRRDAARSLADGIADLHQRGRRPEDRRRPEGGDHARRRSDEEARGHGHADRQRRRAAPEPGLQGVRGEGRASPRPTRRCAPA